MVVEETRGSTPWATPASRRRWKPTWQAIVSAILLVGGVTAVLYPGMAAWFSEVNQSTIITSYLDEVVDIDPDPASQLEAARSYNDALVSGAVVEAGANVPVGAGTDDGAYSYESLLRVNNSGLMGRIMIPKIDVDLPIYHGTDEATLLEGAGHLQGTSLPVGGEHTRSVITAHRGLASARMFTDLNKVEVGDTFALEVVGEVLTYRVIEAIVVAPDETESIRVVAGQDLVTLITCTPLGVNTHRILVTGERVYPTPEEDVTRAQHPPAPAGFPWWAVGLGSTVLVAALYIWRSGLAAQVQASENDA